ncbi:hypothetical protein FA13DRAFT_1734776 [Coprinellus micaceus]|uniref:Nephrocystin 3-like N-terminal domain-containing protein n=1 Tax=Coprinellus micaceus TaxID=71717 RepID=A0A4Y7T608_COPMI|nr:hypothetical protein FA13DRAFT_1734776 [Coprinellus micaceus]
MSAGIANVTGSVREINQRIANTYIDQGISTTTNLIQNGGHYSSYSKQTFLEINAHVYGHNDHDALQPGSPNTSVKDLYDNIAPAALHNSSYRRDAPRCLQGTRTEVQREIFRWIAGGESGGQSERILWLSGPVGIGKSAIMGTVADKLQKEGKLAAAFFFPSNTRQLSEGRDKGRFVTTLAYQLIQHDDLPFLRHHILSCIEKNPAIFQMHLKEQLEVLILKPLREEISRRQTSFALQHPKVIVVDGVDECGPDFDLFDKPTPPNQFAIRHSIEQNKAEIISVLQQAVDDEAFPFQIILSIREFVPISPPGLSSSGIFLDKRYNPDVDIAFLLRHELAKIRSRHLHLLPATWPGEEIISRLVEEAAGLFIYIVTVIRFIERPPKPPHVRLNIVLGLDGAATLPRAGIYRTLHVPTLMPVVLASPPFIAPLDELYARLIWTSSNPLLVVRWLKAFHDLSIEPGVSTWFFHRLCESCEGEAALLFESTSALVRITSPTDFTAEQAECTFYHPSFQDFCTRYWVPMLIENAREEMEAQRRWIIGRFIRAFKSEAPQVAPTDPSLLSVFGRSLIHYWQVLLQGRGPDCSEFYDEDLLSCDPNWWLPLVDPKDAYGRDFTRLMFALAHTKVSNLFEAM